MFSYEGILAKLQAMVIQNKRDVTIFITKFEVKWQVAITSLKIYGTLQEIKQSVYREKNIPIFALCVLLGPEDVSVSLIAV